MFTPIDTITLDHGVSVKVARETSAYVARLAQAESERLSESDLSKEQANLRAFSYVAALGVLVIINPHVDEPVAWPPLPMRDPVALDEAIAERLAIIEQMPASMIGAVAGAIFKRSGLTRDEGNGSAPSSAPSGEGAPTPPASETSPSTAPSPAPDAPTAP